MSEEAYEVYRARNGRAVVLGSSGEKKRGAAEPKLGKRGKGTREPRGLAELRICGHCKQEYRTTRADQSYCSQYCGNTSWKLANSRPPKTDKVCPECSTPFATADDRQVCCCKACGQKAHEHRRFLARQGGPGQGLPGVERVPRKNCERCGSRFLPEANQIKKGQGKYCSYKCRFAAAGIGGTPIGRSRGKGGRRSDLGDRYFRSTWEANWARYLNWLKAHGKLKDWQYEVDTFEFIPIKRGSRLYTPDFKLFEMDGAVHYHEVKGWMDPTSLTKLKRMKRYHPRVKVTVIDGPIYREVGRQIGSLLPNWERPG